MRMKYVFCVQNMIKVMIKIIIRGGSRHHCFTAPNCCPQMPAQLLFLPCVELVLVAFVWVTVGRFARPWRSWIINRYKAPPGNRRNIPPWKHFTRFEGNSHHVCSFRFRGGLYEIWKMKVWKEPVRFMSGLWSNSFMVVLRDVERRPVAMELKTQLDLLPVFR